jgi:hypothetical protein
MTLTIISESILVGGPKLILASQTAISGNTTATFDLSGKGTKIDGVVCVQAYKTAAAHTITHIDYTTVKTTLTVTFADPTANITIYATVLIR